MKPLKPSLSTTYFSLFNSNFEGMQLYRTRNNSISIVAHTLSLLFVKFIIPILLLFFSSSTAKAQFYTESKGIPQNTLSSSQTANPTSCKRITLSEGATLDIGLNTLTVTDTAFINAGADGYAQVIGDISGLSAVESYRTDSSAAWLNVAFPVNATLANVLGVTVNATGNAATCNIYRFDASVDADGNDEGDWIAISSTGDPTENIGYQLYLDNGPNFGSFPATITSYGNLLDGNQQVAVYDATTNPWNLIPNPFPSTLEWNSFTADADNSELANTTYYIQDGNPTIASVMFRTYNGTTGTNGGSNNIPPGQSFFVEADATGDLIFKNSFRNVTGTTSLYKSQSLFDFIKLKVENKNTKRSDETVFGFDASFSLNMDNTFDAVKRRNHIFPNLFSKSTGEELVYNGLNNQFATFSKTLYFSCSEDGDYAIQISDAQIPSSWTVELEDVLTNSRTRLNSHASYTFQHQNGNLEDRFILHINSSSIGTQAPSTHSIFSYIKNDLLFISSDYTNRTKAVIFDMSGKALKIQDLNGQTLSSINLFKIPKGIYLLKVYEENNELYSQKLIR